MLRIPESVTDLAPAPDPVEVAVWDGRDAVSYGALRSDGFGLRRRIPRGAVVQLTGRTARTLAAALFALDGWAARVELLGHLEPDPTAPGVVIDDTATAGPPDPGDDLPPLDDPVATHWRLFTSGTTGTPKAVDHGLGSLMRTTRPGRPGGDHRRWGLLYEPSRMAGIQVVLQSLTGGDELVDATGASSLPDRLRMLAAGRVDSLSATPTVWRQILQSPLGNELPFRQVTLGGEIADQQVLTALTRAFPQARITHVYAATETGAAFAVSDGREGFPRAWLAAAPRGIRLDVRDDVLFIEAAGSSAAGPDGFADTGDVVSLTEDRVLFHGRASGTVNVGGVKVAPEQVERVLRAHPDVADAVVRSKRNPFSGWILTADVVPTAGAACDGLPARVRAAVADRLPAAYVPAVIKVVPELITSVTGKAGR